MFGCTPKIEGDMSNAFDPIIWNKARSHGVDPVLVKAVVAAESNFNARAFRAEPQINDASYGLMQTLYATAKDMGYAGPPEGLYDPATSVEYGTRYLKRQLVRYQGRTPFAVAAYNSGTAYQKADGSFTNQAYVDRVLRWYARFREQKPAEEEPGVFPSAAPVPSSASSTPIRMAAGSTEAGERVASVETFLNEDTAPWVIAVGGAMLLAALSGRRR